MKKLLCHKWVIPVAALMLTLSIGAVAWAGVGSAGAGLGAPALIATGDDTPEGGEFLGGKMGRGGHGMRGFDGLDLTEGQKAQLEERRANMEARRHAMLDLIKGKMLPEDLAQFEQLQVQAEQQREALKEAQENLKNTHEQMRDLTDKYLDTAATDTTTDTTSESIT